MCRCVYGAILPDIAVAVCLALGAEAMSRRFDVQVPCGRRLLLLHALGPGHAVVHEVGLAERRTRAALKGGRASIAILLGPLGGGRRHLRCHQQQRKHARACARPHDAAQMQLFLWQVGAACGHFTARGLAWVQWGARAGPECLTHTWVSRNASRKGCDEACRRRTKRRVSTHQITSSMRQCRAVRMVARPKFFSDASDLGFNDDANIP